MKFQLAIIDPVERELAACPECGGRFARGVDDPSQIAYCEWCGDEWHPTDLGYDRLFWSEPMSVKPA